MLHSLSKNSFIFNSFPTNFFEKVKNPGPEDRALIYPQRGFVMPARHRELRRGGRACYFSVFWNNGVIE